MLVKAKEDCWTAHGEYVKAGQQFEYNGPKHDSLISVKKTKADADEAAAAAEAQADLT